MAGETGLSVGFDLSSIERAAKKADESLNKIIDTGGRLESALTKNFKNIVLNGVSPFISSLTDAENKLSDIGKINGVSKTIDDINKLTAAFREVGSGSNYSSIEQSMQSLMDRIKILKAEMDMFQSVDQKGSNILNVGDYEHIGKVADELNRLMLQYETLDNTLKQLKEGENLFQNHQEHMDGASLSAQKEKHELEKLNETFRTGTSLLQRQSKEQDAKDKEAARIHQEEMRRQEEKNKAISDAARVQNILSGLEPQSLNNLTFAISQMTQEQEKLDLSTREGVKRYKELELQIGECEGQIERARGASSKLTGTISQLGGSIAAAFSIRAIIGYVKSVAEVRGEFELQHKSLQALIGDIGEANKLWNKTVNLAVNSPFRVKELVRYTKQLSAYRIETDKLYDKTKMLADISAGLGVDMDRLILAYGQVKAANYLRGTELRQFSEAGINILEGLSKYFEAIEGRAVSVGEVFERVSKRMVSFADVDAVLQKATSEGEAFYKMQEKQSETLKGLVANLKDSVDLMLNQIGTVNEGLTKNAIKSVKSLIDNWRLFAELIKNGAIVLAISSIVKSIIPLGNLFTTAAIKLNGLTLSSIAARMPLKQLAFGFKELTAAMLSNPLFWGAVAITGIVAVLSVIRAHAKEVKEANKVYEEAAKHEAARAQSFRTLTDEIEHNNDIIKNSQKGTKEYNSALEANEGLLKRLKKEYPTVTEGTTQVKDDITEVTAAIAAQNEELRTNIALQYAAKGDYHLDDLRKNYADVLKEQAALDNAIESTKGAALTLSHTLEYAFNNKLIDEAVYSHLNKLVEEIYDAKDATELIKLHSKDWLYIYRNMPIEITDAIRGLVGEFGLVISASNLANKEYSELETNIRNQQYTIKKSITELDNAVERGKWVNSYLSQFDIVDERISKWAKGIIQKIVGVEVKIEYPDETPDTKLEPWAQRVTEEITKINNKIQQENENVDVKRLFPLPNTGELKEQYLERVQPIIDLAKKKYAEGQQIEDDTDVAQTKALNKYLDDVLKVLNIFDDTTSDKDDKVISKRISLIKNLREEYLKLNQTFNADVSYNKVFEGFKDAFEQAGMNLKDIDFTSWEGIIAALSKLKPLAQKEGKEAQIALQKEIGEVQVEIDVTETQDEQDRLLEQIEDMFGNYEISLELDKLNIPQDLANKIFGIESMDLSELRDAVLSIDTSTFGEDALKKYEEFTKKLEKMEDDARMARLKTYTKYLREEQDERIKIKLEEIRKLEEVESMNEYDDAQKATIKANIRAEAEKDMMKKSWESFEQSPDFLNLFDDMSKATTQSLEDMKRTLDNLKGSMIAAGLPASDLKEILDKINQVEEELENRKPFQSLKEDWSTLFGSDYKKALNDEKTLLEERRRLEDEKKSIEDSGPDDFQLNRLNTEKDRLSSLEKGSEEYRQQKELVDGITKSLYPNQERYEEILKLLEQNGVKLDEAQSKTRKWKDSCEDIAEHFIAIGDAVNQVGGALGTTLVQMGLMSEETKAIYDSYMSVADNAFNLGGNVMKLIANPADPQAWVGAITNTISMIGNIAATGDAVREKQIQAEMKNVDRLEKAYEKLEKAMEDAYTIDQLNANRKSMEQNIDAQIKSLESAKAKEEANKNVDQDAVDDYADRINELEEKKAELQRETVERLGGTYDYASVAEDFLDDWLTAFEETGDGLTGLEKSFDEFWKNILKKQVIYRGASDIVKNYVSSINKALENDSIIDDQEEKDIAAAEELAKEQLNAYFAYMNEKYNLANLAEGELSGLQAGIHGITEEQAGILEAYWNAVRMDVSAVRFRFEDYANKMLSSDVEVNPMLSQLTTIANHTSAINTLLDSVAKNSADDGSLGIRVYMNNA